MKAKYQNIFAVTSLMLILSSCFFFGSSKPKSAENPDRNIVFVGVDISGSFMNRADFDDSLNFLSKYIYTHLKGYGDSNIPSELYVGSIGGRKKNEAKTFFPIHTFQNKSHEEIRAKLKTIFPKKKPNRFTDYNAFFKQVSVYIQQKNLSLRPIDIILLSDGIPDTPKKNGKHDYRSFNLMPLEEKARNLTIRLLYTSAVVGMNWQTKVPRNRVKIWTQDAAVMRDWKDNKIYQPKLKFEDKKRFFKWIKDNVDYQVTKKVVP